MAKNEVEETKDWRELEQSLSVYEREQAEQIFDDHTSGETSGVSRINLPFVLSDLGIR
jgi:hypothetical protein